MSEQQSSYRKIIKATSIFGGVQVFMILISILRSKFVALFLGSSGMGTLGLLNATLGLVGGLTNFGLGTSAIREVSAANSTGDLNKIATVLIVLRRLVWITGILGALIIVIFSSFLSEITFGNNGYIWSFILVSFTTLFNQLNTGQLAVLQGMQKIHFLAKASLSGSFLGLLLNVPIYYYYGVQGIVPALILASMISFFISRYYAKKIIFPKLTITNKETFFEGKKMIKMGFLISLNGLFVIGSTYIIQLFINKYGGVSQVGLFTAGFAIINTYVGLIFTAMATDYYPRLSAVGHSNELCKKEINQQAEISILILGPIIMIFLVFSKLIILILYSGSFYDIIDMVSWLALAIFLKAITWSIGFVLLAKGESKIFFWNDFIGSLYLLIFDLLGYYIWGLTGLGISFFIGYIVYFSQVYFLCKLKYDFSFEKSFQKIFIFHFCVAILTFCTMKFVSKPYSFFFGITFLCTSLIYSFIELDKRLGMKDVLKKLFKYKKYVN